MSHTDLEYKMAQPPMALAPFVESFWMLANRSGEAHDMVILPDGRVDLFFSLSATDPYHVMLMALGSTADQVSFAAGTIIFAVSFKLPAVEYILHTHIAAHLNDVITLPAHFWGISPVDLRNFDAFCNRVTAVITEIISQQKTDDRKLQLFEFIYATHGAMSVNELSAKTFWSSRQINRYFNDRFGLSLKAYCNILRFRASFGHIKEGRLFPEQTFADQSHFIKNVKKYAGVIPKELSKNKNDRFIQFSTLTGE